MNIRKYIANKLVSLAWKIDPESSKVKDFYKRHFMDILVSGNAITRIDPMEMYKENEDER